MGYEIIELYKERKHLTPSQQSNLRYIWIFYSQFRAKRDKVAFLLKFLLKAPVEFFVELEKYRN